MKKLLSVIALLLLCAFALASCTPPNTNGTDDSSAEESTYFAPGEIWGIWYAKDHGAVLELREEEKTVSFYSLTTGYYEYYSVQSGTYKKKMITY